MYMTHFSVLCKKYECIKNIKWFMKRGDVMRVYCTVCGQRGGITNSNQLSHDVSDLYCQCADAECGQCCRITNTNQLSNDVSGLYCQCADAECGHLVVRPHLKPFGKDYQADGAGIGTGQGTYSRGAAVGTQRTGGAIALHYVGSPAGNL